MSGIAMFLPREKMLQETHKILEEENYQIDDIKVTHPSIAISEARKALSAGINIIIARGYQASLIKKYTKIPVVEIRMTAQEMGLLIKRAKKLAVKKKPTIAVVGFENLFCDMSYFNELYDINLRTYFAHDPDEYAICAQRAVEDDVDVVIGGDVATSTADNAGIPNLFLSSTKDSLREALEVANKLRYVSEIEKKNIAQQETILDNSFSGIVKTDIDGNIILINPAMESILHIRSEEVVGTHIYDLIVELEDEKIREVLEEGKRPYSTLVYIDDIAIVVIVAAIKIDDKIDGAILTCHKVNKLKQTDSDEFREQYLSGYIAKANFSDIKHKSKGIQRCIDLARGYAKSNSPVLITGEIGTEKDLFAQSIHNNSLFKNGPFVSISCNETESEEAQNEMLFGSQLITSNVEKDSALGAANNGTILIQDIDKLCMSCQSRLFKTIQYKFLVRNDIEKINVLNVRVIATTSKNLNELVPQNLFNEGLFYILNSLRVNIPSLHDRQEDLYMYIDLFMKEYNDRYSTYHVITAGGKKVLLEHPWHGNIIQLRSFFERMILSAQHRTLDEIYVKNLISELNPPTIKGENTGNVIDEKQNKNIESQAIITVLKKYNGNRTLTSEELGISKTTLWRRMKEYGITVKYNNIEKL